MSDPHSALAAARATSSGTDPEPGPERINALCDGVVSIALTVLALEIRLPEHREGPLRDVLLQVLPSALGFLLSFAVIGGFWLAHHRLTRRVRRISRGFNLANIGGPSAGLMFSLAVVDKLTTGDLNDDKFVAGTGTIAPDGAVGPIGGITQKARAAVDAGASLFLYPASTTAKEVKELGAIAKGHMAVRAVATVDDAIKILAPEGLPQPGSGS